MAIKPLKDTLANGVGTSIRREKMEMWSSLKHILVKSTRICIDFLCVPQRGPLCNIAFRLSIPSRDGALARYLLTPLCSSPPFDLLLLRPLLCVRFFSLTDGFVHAFMACEYFPGRGPIIYSLMSLSLFKRKYDRQIIIIMGR